MGGCVLLRLIGVILAFSSLVSSDMVRVTIAFSRVVIRDKVLLVRETGHLLLQVAPNLKVKGSPEEITSLCERNYIIGVSRFQHLNMYAHSLKLIVNTSTGGNIHVCSHRNVSIPIGMCPHDQWEKISNGSWYHKMVPFDHKILDLRVDEQLTLQVSIVKEFFMYRILFLMLGTLLLSLASRMTRSSLAFDHACSFSSFIFVALLVLFQLIKHLRSGPSFSVIVHIFIPGDSCVVFSFASHYLPLLFIHKNFLFGQLGLGACVILPYVPGWWRSMERALGYDEAIELKWISLYLIGASFVPISLKRFVWTQDGSVDITTAHFYSWGIWIFGVLLILQSSVDPLLAGGALISIILMLSMFKKITRLIFPSKGIITMRE